MKPEAAPNSTEESAALVAPGQDDSKHAATLWGNDGIQFARLLAELRAIGLTDDQYIQLNDATDLTQDEIDELFERAEIQWQADKETHRQQPKGRTRHPAEVAEAAMHQSIRTWVSKRKQGKLMGCFRAAMASAGLDRIVAQR